jgi:hypothetical protein
MLRISIFCLFFLLFTRFAKAQSILTKEEAVNLALNNQPAGRCIA